MTIKKKIVAGVIIMFIILNILWGVNYLLLYRPFYEKINNTGDLQYFEHNNYTFGISDYQYLSFDFNLSISENRYLNSDMNDASDVTADLIIWISPFSEKEYGVTFFAAHLTENDEGYNSFDVMIDSDGNPLDVLTPQEQEVFDQFSGKIELLFEEYNEIWGLQ